MRTLKFMALSMLTLTVGLAADHPITIAGGSPLTIEHSQWNPIDDNNLGSSVSDHVTRVVIRSAGSSKDWSRPFKMGERLDLSLTYGTVQLTVTANHKAGQEVVVTTNKSFSKDFQKQNHQFVRDETGASIANVTVKKDNTDLGAPTVSGHAQITICYGTPDNNSVAECQ